jgi:hypothetical protein
MTLAPEPLGFRCGGSSPPLARTHSGIFTPHRSSPPSRRPSRLWGRSPTAGPRTNPRIRPVASVTSLSPDHFRRKSTRLVSYYALFKGMAASKPTSQLSEQIHILCFSTEPVLRDLSRRSGFLPSRSRTLSHGSCLPGSISQVFGVCLGSVGGETPSPMQCSTPRRHALRPYLNMFRREPAISQFDWPFTPIHSSSERFSTHNGSALHSALPELQPGHG